MGHQEIAQGKVTSVADVRRNLVLTKLKRYQVFLSDRAKQDLRDIHDYILVNFYSQQGCRWQSRFAIECS